MILALDPGTVRTAYVWLDEEGHVPRDRFGILPNRDVPAMLRSTCRPTHTLAVEMVASYGMPVGREVFETCVWIGRFIGAWTPAPHALVYRRDVKLHLCGSSRAKDANVRQALLDRFPRTGGGAVPQVGTKKQPGPLYGFSRDLWAALGVALTYHADPERFRPLGAEVAAA